MSSEPSDVHYSLTRESRSFGAESALVGPKRKRNDWRLGGSSVRRWDVSVLLVSALCGSTGVAISGVTARIPASWAPSGSVILLWISLVCAVVFAFSRSRPAGLLRFRLTDLLWGIAVGLTLRLVQGVMSGADANAFPIVSSPDGTVPVDWWSTVALRAAIVSPLVEEFFFRAVLLVTLFQLLRRAAGRVAASAASVLATSGAFLLIHLPFESLDSAAALQVFSVGVACGLLVMLTGRIWSAVIAHVAYNASILALAVIGTLLA